MTAETTSRIDSAKVLRPAKRPRAARKNEMVAELLLSDRRQRRLVASFLSEQERLATQPPSRLGTAATELLAALIQSEAYRTALRRGFRDRDAFAASIPADVLYPLRKKVATRPIELYRPGRPFLPWLRTVLGNFLTSVVTGRRKQVSDSELLAQLPDDAGPDVAERIESARPDAAQFTAEMCARMETATTLQRLVIFLAMTGLHQSHPDWTGLLARYAGERLKPKQGPRRKLPRSFPSPAVERFDTPRMRTRPLSAEIGLKCNTVSKNFERARKDLAELFPHLAAPSPVLTPGN